MALPATAPPTIAPEFERCGGSGPGLNASDVFVVDVWAGSAADILVTVWAGSAADILVTLASMVVPVSLTGAMDLTEADIVTPATVVLVSLTGVTDLAETDASGEGNSVVVDTGSLGSTTAAAGSSGGESTRK